MAENADGEARLYMGVFHANGNVVERDYAAAAHWFRLAAEQGNATAQRNLAVLYDFGIGVERDYVEAVKWYKRSAKQLEPAAYMGLARFLLTFNETVFNGNYCSYDLYRSIAATIIDINGVTFAPYYQKRRTMEHLFWELYYKGKEYYLDDALLFERLRERAETGDDEAQLRVAACYFQGQGVERSAEDFSGWLARSARTNLRARFMMVKESSYYLFDMFVFEKDENRRETLGEIAKSNIEPFFHYWNVLGRFNGQLFSPRDGDWHYDSDSTAELVKMAESGYLLASRQLCGSYQVYGLSVMSADKWFSVAKTCARAGDLFAKVLYTYFLIVGMGCDADYDAAWRQIEEMFQSIDARGIIQLGYFMSGAKKTLLENPVPGVDAPFIEFLKSKADGGDVKASLTLFLYHRNLDQEELSLGYLDAAVESGHPAALFFFSLYMESLWHLENLWSRRPKSPDALFERMSKYMSVMAGNTLSYDDFRDAIAAKLEKESCPAIALFLARRLSRVKDPIQERRRRIMEILKFDDFENTAYAPWMGMLGGMGLFNIDAFSEDKFYLIKPLAPEYFKWTHDPLYQHDRLRELF